jgi:hypothetical protein
MIRSIVSYFRGNPLCVGCEEHPVASEYLCRYCLAKVAQFCDKQSEERCWHQGQPHSH